MYLLPCPASKGTDTDAIEHRSVWPVEVWKRGDKNLCPCGLDIDQHERKYNIGWFVLLHFTTTLRPLIM